jgi:hypothetical protein
MKTYIFNWSCDEVYGEIELPITAKEVELIKESYRNAFAYLEEDSDLDDLRDRAVKEIDIYDPDEDQDIRIYFPEEITDKVDEEDDP